MNENKLFVTVKSLYMCNLSGWFVETHLKARIVTAYTFDIKAINSILILKGLILIVDVELPLSSENLNICLIVYSLLLPEMRYYGFKK